MEPIIKVSQLQVAFGERKVIDGIDLEVYPGETVAVIGPSGAGKSTIMKILTGLLEPTSGKVEIMGKDTAGYSETQWDELRKHMGVVFQYSALFDFLTVAGNVAFGLKRHLKLPKEEVEQKVAKLLELVGMEGTQELMPVELSGGMKKRVGLARALAMQPEIVLYDEPTSGLDPIRTMNISRLIRKTQERFGVAAILVTHDMESAYYAADRIALLYEGKLVIVDTPENIRKSDNPIVRAFVTGQEIEGERVNEYK